MIYDEEFETLPREVLEALQLKRLKQVVQRVYHTVGFYRRALDEAGVQPDDIKTLDDLKRFPFTTKQDLRENYPFGRDAYRSATLIRDPSFNPFGGVTTMRSPDLSPDRISTISP